MCFKKAQDRHDIQARGESRPELEPVRGFPEEFESRLVIVLLKVLPDAIKTPALETDESEQGIGSLRLLEELYLRVRPGGLEEQQTLVKFLRNLSPAASAREAMDILRRWRLAKNRVSALALPEIPAYEQVKGIMTLLRTLEKRHDALKTRLALVRIHPDVQLGKPGGVTHLLDAVEQELRRLSADETTKDNLNQVAEPFAAKGKGDKGAGKGAPGPKTLEARRHVPCPYMDKPGGCSFGDRCHYRHDMPDKPHPKAKPKPKAEAKKKCIFHNRQGGCKLGFTSLHMRAHLERQRQTVIRLSSLWLVVRLCKHRRKPSRSPNPKQKHQQRRLLHACSVRARLVTGRTCGHTSISQIGVCS